MRLAETLRAPLAIDPTRVAGRFAVLAGVGSLVEPYWTGLVEVLLAVAAVGFLGSVRARPQPPRGAWVGAGGAAVTVGVALALPAPWAAGRGALLGAAAAALAWAAARGRRGGSP